MATEQIYDSADVAISGDTKGTDAGNYTTTFTLQPGRVWADGTTSDKKVPWEITKAPLAIPTTASNPIFTGASVTPTWNHYDTNLMSISGQTSGIEDGSYDAVFTLTNPNYQWADGTTAPKTVSWTIGNATIVTPTPSDTFLYTGTSITATWDNYDVDKMSISGQTTGTGVGTYTVTFTPKNGYAWEDGTETAKSVTWKILAAAMGVPTVSGSYTYTSATVTPSWTGYDATRMTISGQTSATDAGTYKAVFTPKDNYTWPDGTSVAKEVAWTIARASIAAPTLSATPTYSGQQLTPTWNGYDSAKMTISGASVGTDAGSYAAIFTPTANYQWTDGTVSGKSIAWTINKASVAAPTVSGSYTYTAAAQTAAWNGYDVNKMTVSGSTSGTNAGNYNAVFTPNSNYQWTDGTTAAKTVTWTIAKATPTFSISKTTAAFTGSVGSTTVTVTRQGTGAITATSNNTSNVTASVSGTTVTLTNKADSDYSGTVVTIAMAADTNYNAATSKTVTCSGSGFIPPKVDLEDTTFSDLGKIAEAGKLAEYFSEGDTIDVTLTTGEKIVFEAIAFGHDNLAAGGKAGMTLLAKNCMTDLRQMNSSNTNSGGFDSSAMYTWLNGEFYNSLPADLKAIVKKTRKQYSSGGGSSTLETIDCNVWLPSYTEMGFAHSTSYSPGGEGTAYPVFISDASRIKNRNGSAYSWWLGSPYASNAAHFCRVNNSGTRNYTNAFSNLGVVPGLCI